MLENYIGNIENIVSTILFYGFKSILILLVALLIISLILLIIGCLIKSQKIKSKFLKVVPSLIFGIFFILLLPYVYIYLKNKLNIV